MAAEYGIEVPLEEGQQSSSEGQVETPNSGLSETNLANLVIDPAEPPKNMGSTEPKKSLVNLQPKDFIHLWATQQNLDIFRGGKRIFVK